MADSYSFIVDWRDMLTAPGVSHAIALCIYFIPAFIALVRRRHNTLVIILVNLALGWTIIGWAIALSWAISKPKPKSKP